MHRTGKEARTDEVLFRTGNRITPPTTRVKQSEWLRLKLPLQTRPVSIKQFTKCKFGSFRTAIAPLVQLSSPVWIQRLKHNLADNTIDKNSNLNLLSDSIDSNSLLHSSIEDLHATGQHTNSVPTSVFAGSKIQQSAIVSAVSRLLNDTARNRT